MALFYQSRGSQQLHCDCCGFQENSVAKVLVVSFMCSSWKNSVAVAVNNIVTIFERGSVFPSVVNF